MLTDPLSWETWIESAGLDGDIRPLNTLFLRLFTADDSVASVAAVELLR